MGEQFVSRFGEDDFKLPNHLPFKRLSAQERIRKISDLHRLVSFFSVKVNHYVKCTNIAFI